MSNDDRLARALREAAKAEEQDRIADARWDALARGELSEDERAELVALAEKDPALSGAPALFEPLGAEAEARFLAAIQHELGAERKADQGAAKAAEPVAGARPAEVVSLDARRRLRRGWMVGSAALALAAGVALWVATRSDGGGAALPEYALLVSGGERDVRADEPKAVTLAPGSRVTMTLRPAEPAAIPLEARAFLVQGSTEIALDAAVEVSADGAVRMAGRVPAAAALAAGEAEIVAAIGRRGTVAGRPATIAELSRQDAVRMVRQRVTWRP
jgi:hypothetical protein